MQSTDTLVSSVASEVEYELSRCFLNHAKDQLFNKQLCAMMESSLLMEKLANSLASKHKSGPSKDLCQLESSHTLDTLVTEEDEYPRTRQRPFTRKTIQAPPRLLSSDHGLATALQEIKQNCSEKTFMAVQSLMQGYNRMKKTISESKAQLNTSGHVIVRPRPDTDRSSGDQAAILATRNCKLQKQIGILNEKVRDLETQLAKANGFQGAKQYIDGRQKLLEKHGHKIERLHGHIMEGLQTKIIDDGCTRCCVLVRKIKESLISYKSCLSEEIEAYRALWQKLHLGAAVQH